VIRSSVELVPCRENRNVGVVIRSTLRALVAPQRRLATPMVASPPFLPFFPLVPLFLVMARSGGHRGGGGADGGGSGIGSRRFIEEGRPWHSVDGDGTRKTTWRSSMGSQWPLEMAWCSRECCSGLGFMLPLAWLGDRAVRPWAMARGHATCRGRQGARLRLAWALWGAEA
jgi:hypothetical protein